MCWVEREEEDGEEGQQARMGRRKLDRKVRRERGVFCAVGILTEKLPW